MKLLAVRPDIKTTLSLAGRTKNPVLPFSSHETLTTNHEPLYRIGGFGGSIGLANYIKEHKITAIVCATHPFARKMPFNAAEATKIAGIPILYLLRPQWQPQAGDKWIEVTDHKKAISSLIPHPSSLNIFLTVGRLELSEYTTAPQHFYVIRSIDEIAEKPLENAVYITARPPFSVENEREIMQKYKIDFLITKNSGGSATEAKITAARELSIPVILINRPARPDGLHVTTTDEALEWINYQVTWN